MQKINKWILCVTLLMFSCNTSTIISEKDMVSILVKMYLTDATVNSSGLRRTYSAKDSIDYHGKTIQSFGYSIAQFDSSMNYYAQEPKVLDAIYDKVIIELSKIETRITDEIRIKQDSIDQDTLKNLWNLKNAWAITTDGDTVTINYNIKTKGLGIYTISADVKVFLDDESVNPSMTSYFFFDDKSKNGNRSSEAFIPFIKTENPKKYSIQMELFNSLVTHIKGSIFSHDNTSEKYTKHADITNIRVSYKPFSNKGSSIKKKVKHLQLEDEIRSDIK